MRRVRQPVRPAEDRLPALIRPWRRPTSVARRAAHPAPAATARSSTPRAQCARRAWRAGGALRFLTGISNRMLARSATRMLNFVTTRSAITTPHEGKQRGQWRCAGKGGFPFASAPLDELSLFMLPPIDSHLHQLRLGWYAPRTPHAACLLRSVHPPGASVAATVGLLIHRLNPHEIPREWLSSLSLARHSLSLSLARSPLPRSPLPLSLSLPCSLAPSLSPLFLYLPLPLPLPPSLLGLSVSLSLCHS